MKSIVSYIAKNQVLVALLFIAAGWLILQIKGVLIGLFVSYIFMAALTPYVDFLEKRRVPRVLAVLVPYFVAISFIALIVFSLLPFFIAQVQLLLSGLTAYLNQDIRVLGISFESKSLSSIATTEFGSIGRNALTITSTIFGGVFSTISVLAITFYLLLYRDRVRKGIASIFVKKYQGRVDHAIREAEEKLGSWLRGQLILSCFIGILTWVTLTAIGIDFALPLAVIAGILEIIPTIGPIISAIPAIIVALNISIPAALAVAISYFFIQLIENNVLVPRIMQKAVGLNPIVIILAIIIGGKLLGVAGAILSIPFISLLVVIGKEID